MNDWLDVALKAKPVDDDGFADRVIAVGRGQDRTRLILRAVITLLSLGAITAVVVGITLHTLERLGRIGGAGGWIERLGSPGVFGEWDDPQAREAAFVADWDRLAEQTFLVRRTQGPVDDRLEIFQARLRNDNSLSRACQQETRFAGCDTSFLVGMRHVDRLKIDAPDLWNVWTSVARAHLRQAATQDGATFATAVDDVSAFAAMLMARYQSTKMLVVIAEEVEAARAQGKDLGGAKAPMSIDDAKRLGQLWWEAGAFVGIDASPTTRQRIIDSDSVIACGARSDPTSMLGMSAEFTTDRQHRDQLHQLLGDPDGCRAPTLLPAREGFCDDPNGLACSAYMVLVKLPGIRDKMTSLLTPIPHSLVTP